uniref:Uncharacterized protein n=1 Tax=Oryza punctata TaxID=4537 RepID=A0A0E0K2W7_ORYPU
MEEEHVELGSQQSCYTRNSPIRVSWRFWCYSTEYACGQEREATKTAVALALTRRSLACVLLVAPSASLSISGQGYEECVKDRGLLVSILSHPATEGFLTHYEWNVALTWPIILDQFSSERLLIDVFGVSVRSGITAPLMYLPTKAEGVQVTNASVETTVAELMDGAARRN